MLGRQTLIYMGVTMLLSAAAFIGVRASLITKASTAVMERIEAKIVAGAGDWNSCYHNRSYGPRKNAARRANPDSIISSMAYDLTNGPVRVSGQTWPRYWSLSLYQQNSDNFFVINDRELEQAEFDYLITARRQQSSPDGAVQIISPTQKGIMLIRRFAAMPSDMPGIIANQDAMSCGPASKS
jgi:uncharacterized membrane protein